MGHFLNLPYARDQDDANQVASCNPAVTTCPTPELLPPSSPSRTCSEQSSTATTQPCEVVRSPRSAISIQTFQWSNDQQFAVPEDWTFPSTMCDTVWTLWFHGDATHGISAFRHLSTHHLPQNMEIARTGAMCSVMTLLVDIALAQGMATSEDAIARLPPPQLRALFESTIQHLYVHATDYLMGPLAQNDSTYSLHSIYNLLQNDPSPVLRNRVQSDPWTFPSTDCRTMWQLWYRGDDAHAEIGPYRHLKASDVGRKAAWNLSRARTVMTRLTNAAVELGMAASVEDVAAMDATTLDMLFPALFQHLIKPLPRQRNAHQVTYQTVYRMLKQTTLVVTK
ncbi:hypothetical protein DYB35_009064 [Aphanomyces astaci]|uniref:Uncharacterized protein n=1 Tax=Aphanomyces astaci TaxID=112090 RepID=A0A3R6WQZ9_APHAT|nr:hypothetical protein DYB35_009064 [Aphanomyces astaci]